MFCEYTHRLLDKHYEYSVKAFKNVSRCMYTVYTKNILKVNC